MAIVSGDTPHGWMANPSFNPLSVVGPACYPKCAGGHGYNHAVHRGSPGRSEESYDVGSPPIDPEELLRRIRIEHRDMRWTPLDPIPFRTGEAREQVRSQESLDYLHHNWMLPDRFEDSGRPGLRSKISRRLGHFVYSVLGPYFRAERDLLAHTVRVNDALEKRCDELTTRILELRQQVADRQVAEARNQAELAVWLHQVLPADGPTDPGAIRV